MKLGHMLTAAAIALTLGAPGTVSAQQSTGTAKVAVAAEYREVENDTLTVQPFNLTAEQLDDMDVVNAAGDTIGEIEEVLMNASGEIVAVSIEVGGFLGMGDTEVIAGLDKLQLEGDRFVTTMTRDEFQTLPKWDD